MLKFLVIIPARGGSKGVPGKNIKILGGKPLIQYTIHAALQIVPKEFICVSTDDLKIKNTVENIGIAVPFLRPDELATDSSGTQEVLLHALAHYENQGFKFDAIILLQPTSPFRNEKHIKEAVSLYNNDLDMLVSVKETKANPYYILREENENGYLVKSKEANFTRRQDCPKVWELNGAIYIINIISLKQNNIGEFQKVKKYEMNEIDSHDIDTSFDWDIADVIIKQVSKC